MSFTIRPCRRSPAQCLVTAFPVETRVSVLSSIIFYVLWWSDGPEEGAFWVFVISLLHLAASVMAPINGNKKLEGTPMTRRRWESTLEWQPIAVVVFCLCAGWFLLKWGKLLPYAVEVQGTGPTDYLSKIFENNQVDLLTIVIALAAYTSAVIINLRETKGKPRVRDEELQIVILERVMESAKKSAAQESDEEKKSSFTDRVQNCQNQLTQLLEKQSQAVSDNPDRTRKIQSRINCIMVGDIVLVVLSILLIFRIVLWSQGRRFVIVDELILAGLFGVVLYFLTQHAYQWKLAAWKVSGEGTDQ